MDVDVYSTEKLEYSRRSVEAGGVSGFDDNGNWHYITSVETLLPDESGLVGGMHRSAYQYITTLYTCSVSGCQDTSDEDKIYKYRNDNPSFSGYSKKAKFRVEQMAVSPNGANVALKRKVADIHVPWADFTPDLERQEAFSNATGLDGIYLADTFRWLTDKFNEGPILTQDFSDLTPPGMAQYGMGYDTKNAFYMLMQNRDPSSDRIIYSIASANGSELVRVPSQYTVPDTTPSPDPTPTPDPNPVPTPPGPGPMPTPPGPVPTPGPVYTPPGDTGPGPGPTPPPGPTPTPDICEEDPKACEAPPLPTPPPEPTPIGPAPTPTPGDPPDDDPKGFLAGLMSMMSLDGAESEEEEPNYEDVRIGQLRNFIVIPEEEKCDDLEVNREAQGNSGWRDDPIDHQDGSFCTPVEPMKDYGCTIAASAMVLNTGGLNLNAGLFNNFLRHLSLEIRHALIGSRALSLARQDA